MGFAQASDTFYLGSVKTHAMLKTVVIKINKTFPTMFFCFKKKKKKILTSTHTQLMLPLKLKSVLVYSCEFMEVYSMCEDVQ